MTPPKIIIFSSMNGRKCFPHMALSGKIYSFFEQNNYLITNNIFEADYVVINTCAFDDFSEQESLEEIDKLYSQFHINQNKLIVVGCLPDISFGEKDWKKDKIIISDRDLLKFDEYFQHNISIHDVEPNFANALKASDA
jgi:tRNA A37 methylthiotransferase MiaB